MHAKLERTQKIKEFYRSEKYTILHYKMRTNLKFKT